MRISELAEREAILESTVWALRSYLGSDSPTDPTEGGALLRLNAYFSVVATPGISRAARAYLRRQYQFSPRLWLGVTHWVVSGALSTSWGFQLSSRALRSHLEDSSLDRRSLVVVPGNRRIRILDFDADTSTVLLKPGFSSDAHKRELDIRLNRAEAFLLPVLQASPDARRIEERLVHGLPLNRAYPGERSRLTRTALSLMHRWASEHARPLEEAAPIAQSLATDIAHRERLVSARFGRAYTELGERTVERLVHEASTRVPVSLGLSHGDFQAGNVLLDPTHGGLYLTDWEYAGWRSTDFDLLTWGLRARDPRSLGTRIRHALRTRSLSEVPGRLLASPLHRATMAFFLLEDSALRLEELAYEPFHTLPKTWEVFVREVRSLDDLWDGA